MSVGMLVLVGVLVATLLLRMPIGFGMLAAGIGSTVTLETIGTDSEEAMQAITALIHDRFGEGE